MRQIQEAAIIILVTIILIATGWILMQGNNKPEAVQVIVKRINDAIR